jgi:exopolyphosphatase/guanosine-5'-triphosphate,3'-diphosphate pyrophosphatase
VTRIAAIDVGTNAMRCVLVEVGEDHEPRVLENVRTAVRLGSQVFLTGQIGRPAGDRAVEAFRAFRGMIDKHQVPHIRAVATSAFREASDAEALRDRIREETGIEIRVISGAEEAHLVRRAVGSALDIGEGRTGAVDVGGGSVEVLVMKDGDVVRAESFDMGAVRLLEALRGDGETDFFLLLTEYVDAIQARVLTALGHEPLRFLAATGGSIVSLADLAGEAAVGGPVLREGIRVIPVTQLRQWIRRLAGVSFHERVERFGLREDRADVILPAGVVYLKIAEIFGVDRVYVPGVGLKEGLVRDTIDELARRGALEERRREIRAAALGFGRRYDLDEPHALRVADLALSLFDQLREMHALGEEARTLLETAAILHDVGLYVSMAKHHKHSYYLVSESDLVGLDRRQREIVANLVRYHRKAHPTTKHSHFAALSGKDRTVVQRLAAILRAADVLDREHRQNVGEVKVRPGKNEVLLELVAEGDLLLERWAARRKFDLFEIVFGVKLVLAEE